MIMKPQHKCGRKRMFVRPRMHGDEHKQAKE
uniref:Uncharacterized protein n=1 Tax=Arundo donax TaxID=35708 RepID=A0A0A8Y001_ARUDO